MNIQQLEANLKADYRVATSKYRLDDEVEVLTENHQRLGTLLKRLSSGYAPGLRVLDVGCGTGRYFHCLEGVEQLVGLDLSEEMLSAARSPVRSEQITARNITLVQGNAHLQTFEPESFHLIYSIGMFGHGCPVTSGVCERFYQWLKPGGTLFFNVVDFAGLPICYRTRRTVRRAVYPWLSKRLQHALDEREEKSPFFCLTQRELESIMSATPFGKWTIDSQPCRSPLGSGRHLGCLALKN